MVKFAINNSIHLFIYSPIIFTRDVKMEKD